MTIPHAPRIAVLVLATTAFYGYVGQMVPQSEVQPPEEIAIRADLTTPEMVEIGRGIAEGKGLCRTCHTIGQSGERSGSPTSRESPAARRSAFRA